MTHKDFNLFLALKDKELLDEVCEQLSLSVNVTGKDHGDEIINTILREQPDLAIFDFDMSEIDVLGLCFRLNNEHPDLTTVIYVSSDKLSHAKQKWKQRAIDFIAAPTTALEFCESVYKIIRYILLDRTRESLLRHKIEMHYIITKHIERFKELIDEALKDRDWQKIATLKDDIASAEKIINELEKYHM